MKPTAGNNEGIAALAEADKEQCALSATSNTIYLKKDATPSAVIRVPGSIPVKREISWAEGIVSARSELHLSQAKFEELTRQTVSPSCTCRRRWFKEI